MRKEHVRHLILIVMLLGQINSPPTWLDTGLKRKPTAVVVTHRRKGPRSWISSRQHRLLLSLSIAIMLALLVIKASSMLVSRAQGSQTVAFVAAPARNSTDQEALIERIYQRSQPFEDSALRQVGKEPFLTDLALREYKNSKVEATKWIWDFFPPNYNCPLKERFGRQARIGDGGKWVCGVETLMQRPGCVVYSFGSNGDTDFEEAVLATTHCEVHVFDPTLGIEALAKLRKLPQIQFHPIGLGPKNQRVQMMDSLMTMGKQRMQPMNLHTLPTIMSTLNHTWIDVLKIDIEGFEYSTLQRLMKTSKTWLPVTQLLVEFHYWENAARTLPKDIAATLKALTSNNFRVFSTEPNWWWTNKAYEFIEYSFLHVDDAGRVVFPN